MAMRVILEARIREEAVDEAKVFFQKCIPDARLSEGCLHSDVFQNEKEPTMMVMVEDWESQEHHKKYLDQCLKSGMLKNLIRFLSGPPNLRYFYAIDV
ncbi:antibiotic biosynthesis monooxygenase [Pontibacter sp. KCTC 32443]|uniref:putative quinol monooxygenase n=1 Tax=Pontibacter TaxID=323449 RepID=UPI00164EB825|nr:MULTISPECIES: antibiotic biosynthesis monooxygenase family protein [Pontibacter]MBC5772847.1 antibiotic biosynthesis monooxygenase [Pontibacter sp. KCTC 32443]